MKLIYRFVLAKDTAGLQTELDNIADNENLLPFNVIPTSEFVAGARDYLLILTPKVV